MKFNRLAVLVPALAALAVPGTAAAAATATSTAADRHALHRDRSRRQPARHARGQHVHDRRQRSDPGRLRAARRVAGDATKVTCVAFKQGSQLMRFEVNLGDGNDSVMNLTTAPMVANGSLGGDTLDGGEGQGRAARRLRRRPPARLRRPAERARRRVRRRRAVRRRQHRHPARRRGPRRPRRPGQRRPARRRSRRRPHRRRHGGHHARRAARPRALQRPRCSADGRSKPHRRSQPKAARATPSSTSRTSSAATAPTC